MTSGRMGFRTSRSERFSAGTIAWSSRDRDTGRCHAAARQHAGPAMALAGGIPVHQPEGGTGRRVTALRGRGERAGGPDGARDADLVVRVASPRPRALE